MKIVAGLGSIDEYIKFAEAGAMNFSVVMFLIPGPKNTERYCP